MPRTTIIVPCHNAALTVERAVGSVLVQSDPDFEVIVIDDGSSDNTLPLLRSFDDPRLKIIAHDQNRGISAARNTGLDAATGEFLAFLDADDEWESDFLDRLHSVRGDADGVVCGRRIIMPDGGERIAHATRRSVQSGDEAAVAMMTGAMTPFPWDKVIRRSAFAGLSYPLEVHRFEDQVVGIIAISRSDRIVAVADPLIRYHVSPSSLTWGRVPQVSEAERALEFLDDGLGAWLDVPRHRDAFAACRTLFLMLTAQSAMRADTEDSRAAIRECRRRITGRMIAATLRRRPFVAAGALLLKCAPYVYRRLLVTYLRRQYAMT